jgi:hypothetical protein
MRRTRSLVGVGLVLGLFGGSLVITGSAVGDTGPPFIAVSDVSVVEGDLGQPVANVAITLSEPGAADVAVRAATDNGNATSADYSPLTKVVKIAAGRTSATLAVKLRPDDQLEGHETFSVTLSDATGGEISRATGVVTILDDDPASATPVLSIGDALTDEGDASDRDAVFTLTLSRPASAQVSVVAQTSVGTADAVDFAAKRATVKIAAGKTSALFKVRVHGDTIGGEPSPEVFAVQLTNAMNATLGRPTGTGSIVEVRPDPGSCVPTTDVPDPSFEDADCDGFDGDISAALLVAPSGGDTPTCGTLAAPCATIQHASIRAAMTGGHDVYVAGSTYGPLTVVNGVSVYGGFGANFQRDPTLATGDQDVVLEANTPAYAVLADGVDLPTVIADLAIVGADAAPGSGGSTTALLVRNSTSALVVARNHIVAGVAGSGVSGTAGTDAPVVNTTAPMNGGPGGAGDEFVTACNDSSRGAGGEAGDNSSPSGGLPMSGGAGGAGGTMDRDCTFPPDFDAQPGQPGGDGAQASGAFGGGGAGGTGLDSCGPTGDGEPGVVQNGTGGTGGAGGSFVAGVWVGAAGTPGQQGENGGGGGGGGGAGGCDDGTDAYGAGGGGGGAGGMAAVSGGSGGSGGGASIAVILDASSATLSDNQITRGTGGAGGAGGIGGRGQSAGVGGPGGIAHPGGAAPGAGGAGGHGGHGGGGGGGAGGPTIGILQLNGATPALTGNTFASGAGGTGGIGGPSAPTAPLTERDGNPGDDGSTGAVLDLLAT